MVLVVVLLVDDDSTVGDTSKFETVSFLGHTFFFG